MSQQSLNAPGGEEPEETGPETTTGGQTFASAQGAG